MSPRRAVRPSRARGGGRARGAALGERAALGGRENSGEADPAPLLGGRALPAFQSEKSVLPTLGPCEALPPSTAAAPLGSRGPSLSLAGFGLERQPVPPGAGGTLGKVRHLFTSHARDFE